MQLIKNFNEKPYIADKLVVLLAEEHPLTAKIQKKELEEGGFKVYSVKTEDEILKIVQNEKIDILLIDYNFSKKKDFAFISKIKNISLNSKIKIMLTSVTSSKIKPSLLNKVDLFIVKPIPKTKMIQELKTLAFQDIRKHERINVKLKATLYIDNKIYKSKIIDISKSGLHLEDKEQKIGEPIGTVIKIALELPKYKFPILLNSILIRKTPDGHVLKILNISLESKNKISKFIEKNWKGEHLEIYYL